jgi:hypothetical protein
MNNAQESALQDLYVERSFNQDGTLNSIGGAGALSKQRPHTPLLGRKSKSFNAVAIHCGLASRPGTYRLTLLGLVSRLTREGHE